MEDYGNYIYFIVFGIIIVSNIIRGAKKAKQKQQNSSNTSTTPQAAKTWEDVLRELQGEIKQTPQAKPAPVFVQTNNLKTKKHKKPTPLAPAFDPSMEGQRAIETPVFEEPKEESVNWTEGIQDLDTLKKAFIMSEILNKKY